MLRHTTDHTLIFIHWLLFTFYITYTYNYRVCIDYLDASTYTSFYNLLQYTFFIFTNNFFSITQLKKKELMMRDAAYFEKVFH